ncbi:hypothetical protein SprV_0401558000 [Sparganum proliferum]
MATVPEKPELNLFDLAAVVKSWALNAFIATRTREQKKVKIDDLDIKVNWDDLHCWSEQPQFSDCSTVTLPKSHSLFSTNFRNNTDNEQEYNFRTERATRSVAEIEISQGFISKKEIGIKLQVPNQILEASAGFSNEISLNETTRQTVEEELVWGVDTRIVVPPHSTAEAEVKVLEEKMTTKFALETKMHGRIRASVLDSRHDNRHLKYIENDITSIVSEHLARPRPKGKAALTNVVVQPLTEGSDQKVVVITTKGRCAFRFGVKQNVEVNQVSSS